MVTAYDFWPAETRGDKASSYDFFLEMGEEGLEWRIHALSQDACNL